MTSNKACGSRHWRLPNGGRPLRVLALIDARSEAAEVLGLAVDDIVGQSLLERVVRRVGLITLIDDVLVVTTDGAVDQPIADECVRLGVRVYRDGGDNLDRHFRAAGRYDADAIVRFRADCPFLDPELSDRVIQAFLDEQPDYATNTLDRTDPRGLDTEVLTFGALTRAWTDATHPDLRDSITGFVRAHESRFAVLTCVSEIDESRHDWRVATLSQLEFARRLCAQLGHDFDRHDVFAVLDQQADLRELSLRSAGRAVGLPTGRR